ncbi:MAG: thioredoxin domain-containing protein [Pyrinomonadaceae bacterium]
MRTRFSNRWLRAAACLWLASACPAQTAVPPQPKQPVARVGGQLIYEEDLLPLVQTQLLPLQNQEYEIKRAALDRLVTRRLVEAEAKSRGVSAEKLLEQEVDAKVGEPTDAEIEAYYLGQRDRIGVPFETIKPQLRQTLKQAKLQQARQSYGERLRRAADVAILLRPPRVQVGYDPSRLRGDAAAPVIIVEFSDFQCPYCRTVEPTLKTLLGKYAGRVSLAYRDYPLREIHPQAQQAAEAARCAGEQDKFWEYHDLLYADGAKLDAGSLTGYARGLGLDAQRFTSCLASGKFKQAVEEDLQAGSEAGVNGTPAFFINGIFLSGAQPAAAFEKIIDAELAAAQAEGSIRPR